MSYRTAVLINFYSADEVSVLFRTDAPRDQEASTELILFASFTLRQLHNLGRNQASSSLGSLLSTKMAALDSASAVSAYCNAAINPDRSDAGEKQFAGNLESGDGRALFQMHTKGFGFLGRGVNYYARESVLALLNFLSNRRSNDRDYLHQLFFVASKCGKLHLAEKISSLNQSQLALALALESRPALRDRAPGRAGLDTRTLQSVERLVVEFWQLMKSALEVPIFESNNDIQMEALLVEAETKLAAAEGCANAIEKVWPDGDGVYDRFHLAIGELRQRHPGIRRFFDSLNKDLPPDEFRAIHQQVMAKNRELMMLSGTYMAEAADILLEQTGIELEVE